jgi:hypothetical protein
VLAVFLPLPYRMFLGRDFHKVRVNHFSVCYATQGYAVCFSIAEVVLDLIVVFAGHFADFCQLHVYDDCAVFEVEVYVSSYVGFGAVCAEALHFTIPRLGQRF